MAAVRFITDCLLAPLQQPIPEHQTLQVVIEYCCMYLLMFSKHFSNRVAVTSSVSQLLEQGQALKGYFEKKKNYESLRLLATDDFVSMYDHLLSNFSRFHIAQMQYRESYYFRDKGQQFICSMG